MATTLRNIVDQVSMNLHGFSDDQETRTATNAGCTSSALVIHVADASNISSGVVEVEDELVWVDSVDSTNGTLTVAPYGRGFGGSTAAAHDSGVMVTSSPRWPRTEIKRNINHVIRQVYPTLFAVKTTSVTKSAPVVSYALPADVDMVLSVSWQMVGPSARWKPVKRWTLDTNADTTAFANGKSLTVFDEVTPGRTLHVTYASAPTELEDDADLLTDTGLSASTEDLLVYGASARMIQQYEASRLQLSTVTESDRAQYVTSGSITSASRALYALYAQRLDEERQRLLRLHPVRSHYTN